MELLTFANNVKFLREKHKYKQSEMLSVLGFKQSTWNGYERGVSTPSLEDFIVISDFFKVSEFDLLHTDLSTSDLIKKEGDVKTGKYPTYTPTEYPT